MKISIIIPFKNDWEMIDSVINHLWETGENNDFEIIVVNDGSVFGSGQFQSLIINKPGVSVVNMRQSWGVGASFDRGVAACMGDVIILQGADVYPKEGWYEKVRNAVSRNPNTLGCAVCIGLNPARMSLDDPKNFKRYGADLLFTVSNDDLPKDSPLKARRGGYTDLFKAKWLLGKQSDEPYEIPCVLGAFYWTTKEFYNKIGGFDTLPNNHYRGQQRWGHLEPYLSLKSWLVGGGCILYPDIEAGHVFNRVTIYNQWSKGGRSAEWMHWNSIFMLETMILDDEFRQKLYNFMHYELNWGVAQKMIKDHWDNVVKVREANRQKFKYDHTIFTEKFNCDFNI